MRAVGGLKYARVHEANMWWSLHDGEAPGEARAWLAFSVGGSGSTAMKKTESNDRIQNYEGEEFA